MGLINNWLNKKDKEQLSKTGEKKSPATAAVAKTKTKSTARATAKTEKKEHDHAEHEPKAVKSNVKVSTHSASFRVLVKPLVTEKSAIAESKNKYSFLVAKSANKNQVKAAVAEIYGVQPTQVNIANVEGRAVRFGRSAGRRGDYKKAIVTLPAGKTIDIHTGV